MSGQYYTQYGLFGTLTLEIDIVSTRADTIQYPLPGVLITYVPCNPVLEHGEAFLTDLFPVTGNDLAVAAGSGTGREPRGRRRRAIAGD